MLGLLLNHKECKEVEYLLKRELEEILLDIEDERIDDRLKRSLAEKYRIVLNLYKRLAPPHECRHYAMSLQRRLKP
nr:hypothetical protein [Salsuginibacillus halophilus]